MFSALLKWFESIRKRNVRAFCTKDYQIHSLYRMQQHAYLELEGTGHGINSEIIVKRALARAASVSLLSRMYGSITRKCLENLS